MTNSNSNYPISKTESTSDKYFGTEIADPYRWLEDENSEQTKTWISHQNDYTNNYCDAIPELAAIKTRLTEIFNYEKLTPPERVGDKYYFWKNSGLQNQPVVVARTELDGQDEIVLDPNELSTDGSVSITKISFSKNNRYLAFGLSDSGSDWNTIQVMDLATKKLLDDKIEWVKFSQIAWFEDGFFYSRYPKPNPDSESSELNTSHSLYYHILGDTQEHDQLIYQDKLKPKRSVTAEVSEDQKYLIIAPSESTSGNALLFGDLSQLGSEKNQTNMVEVVSSFENDFDFLGNEGGILYFLTNWRAPNNQIIAIDATKVEQPNWQTVISAKTQKLASAVMSDGRFVCNYIENAHSELVIYDPKINSTQKIEIETLGEIHTLTGKNSQKEIFFGFSSFVAPAVIYKLDVLTLDLQVIARPKVNFDSESFETKQIFYKSKDGTQIPMFVTHKKGLVLNGQNPTWLYGYGGFNISILPFFSPTMIYFLEQGGVFCVPNIRGGGEFGEAWHLGGTKFNKQNVFDDFIAAAESLIAQKYTNPKKLAIEGGSNGGLLVGACLTQRPDLFRVCLPVVGVMDMLKYHKFTIGWAWATDYGTSEDSIEMFNYLFGYSPLHNCKPTNYPAVLIMTADHDDRVVPAHSLKFGAALQKAQLGINPILIRVDTKAGHGTGKSVQAKINDAAFKVAFALQNME